MDNIGLIVAIAKSIPDTAAKKAEDAQEAAETAAELAQHYGYGMSIENEIKIITSEVDD